MNYLKSIPQLWCFKASEKFYSGIPDIIGCYRGKFFAIELKRPGQIKLKPFTTPSQPTNNETESKRGLANRDIQEFIKNGARQIQAYTLIKIQNSNGFCIVADSLEQVRKFIETIERLY